mgnify:CR=1 FL=1
MNGKTYMLRVWNTLTNTYDTVAVTQEVYNEYRRSYWREEKGDVQYQNRTLPLYEAVLNKDRAVHTDPEHILEGKEQMEALASALQQLGRDEYELFEALFFDELTEAQYARKLGVSQQAVNQRKQRIKKHLRKMLEGGC